MPIKIVRGGVYDVDWSPSRGSEQAGIRPSLVIQNDIGNSVAAYPITIVLAISSKIKGYPSMVRIEPNPQNGLNTPSEINTGQILSVDKSRLVAHRGMLTADEIKRVEEKLAYMLDI